MLHWFSVSATVGYAGLTALYPIAATLPRREVERFLPEVEVNPGESIETALKRFKKKMQKAGILSDVKRRERYEKPSQKRKRKKEAAVKRARKAGTARASR